LRILLIHERYQYAGGEDIVFEAEKSLLTAHGHEVAVYERNNEEINRYSPLQKAALLYKTTWAPDSYRDFTTRLEEYRPQIAHFHNTFPLISPAAYYACARAGIPVVQTLHNYRLICPVATLYRDGHVCTDCVGRLPWPGILHACYRDSRAQTAAVAAMATIHRGLRTWSRKVDTYIAVSDFARAMFIRGGLPADKVVVKPNFVPTDPGPREGDQVGRYALFVGRLSPEKGIDLLLDAWRSLPDIPLQIIGDGPLRNVVTQAAQENPEAIQYIGPLPHQEVLAHMKSARFVVVPSTCYETFSLITLEAFACGVPVIGPNHGVFPDFISPGSSGMLFDAGEARDLAKTVQRLWSEPDHAMEMGINARRLFEGRYRAAENYEALIAIYHRLTGERSPC